MARTKKLNKVHILMQQESIKNITIIDSKCLLVN